MAVGYFSRAQRRFNRINQVSVQILITGTKTGPFVKLYLRIFEIERSIEQVNHAATISDLRHTHQSSIGVVVVVVWIEYGAAVEDKPCSLAVPCQPLFEYLLVELGHLPKRKTNITHRGGGKAHEHVKGPTFAGADDLLSMFEVYGDG